MTSKSLEDTQAELANANRLIGDYRWQLGHNRLPADERYQRDPVFRALVDTMVYTITRSNYTPTELREAAMLAAVIHENSRLMEYVVIPE